MRDLDLHVYGGLKNLKRCNSGVSTCTQRYHAEMMRVDVLGWEDSKKLNQN